ncbi:hypothetical protein Bca4012_094843 [Brassica carinata]
MMLRNVLACAACTASDKLLISTLSRSLSLLGKILKLVFELDKVTLGSLVNRFYLKNRVSEAVSLYSDMLVVVNSLSGREACDNYGKLVSRV